ncbi:MAG: hypothetical protein LBP30_04615 [Clostridiales Family XIII bacterium]|jgi:hypothetical protein|nr:hypothetical protein [Clostridiales Family XIII bacterium]
MSETGTNEGAKSREPAFSATDLLAYAQEREGKMQAQISSFEKGLEIHKGISAIRIRGRNANLMILEDYTPIVSQLDGDIDLIGKDVYHTMKGVRGFFCHVHNVFFLILNETAIAKRRETAEGGEGGA